MNRRDFLKYAAAAGLTAVAAREAVLQTSARDLARQPDAPGVSAFSGGPGGVTDADSFASLLAPIGASGTFLRSDGSAPAWSDQPIVRTPSSNQVIQPSGNLIPLTIKEGVTGQTAVSFLVENLAGNRFLRVLPIASSDTVLEMGNVAGGLVSLRGNIGGSTFDLVSWNDTTQIFQIGAAFGSGSKLNLLSDTDIDTDPLGLATVGLLPRVAGAVITATATGATGTGIGVAGSGHRHGVSLATLAQLADVAATEDLGAATSFVRGDHRHGHGSGYLPDAHHAQSHGVADHSGDIIPDANQDAGAFFEDRGQIAAPANPAAGIRRLFVDSADGKLKVRTSAGTSVSLEEGGGAGEANTISFMVYFSKTKTNIGTAYVDIYNTLEPDELFNVIDFTNFADFRIIFIWDYVGVGTQQVRWVNRANNANVLLESATFTADQDGTDSGWVVLPAWATGEKQIEWQGKSTTGTDDPIAKGFILLLR